MPKSSIASCTPSSFSSRSRTIDSSMSAIITYSVISRISAFGVEAGLLQDPADIGDDLRARDLRADRFTAMCSGGSLGKPLCSSAA